MLEHKLSLLVVVHDRVGTEDIINLCNTCASPQSCVGLLELSYFRLSTVKHLSFCSFNFEGQHRKGRHKFSECFFQGKGGDE